jgi:hypothetical protein
MSLNFAEVVLAALTGGGLTAIVGVLGIWLASSREHVRWLRQEGLTAYREFLAVIDHYSLASAIQRDQSAEETPVFDANKYVDEIPMVASNVVLVGPENVRVAALELREALRRTLTAAQPPERLVDEIDKRREEFIIAARTAVRINA